MPNNFKQPRVILHMSLIDLLAAVGCGVVIGWASAWLWFLQ